MSFKLKVGDRTPSKLKGKSEELDQQLLVNWFKRTYPDVFPWLHHSPNGGRRDALVGQKMKMMGTKPGVPDLMLFVPVGEWVGLAVELKHPNGRGRLSPEQAKWIEHLSSQGWQVVVCNGMDEGKEAFRGYLDGD